MSRISKQIISSYSELIKKDTIQPETLPFVPQNVLELLVNHSCNIFESEPTLLQISQELIVVGDLHGHLYDLLRILRNHGLPPERNYLFLGDLVDRGEFSIETITLILAMKVEYPNNVFLVRGNHEQLGMIQKFGFSNELNEVYKTRYLEATFARAFNQIPLAALVINSFYCVHGGIGPNTKSILQIMSASRPILDTHQEPAYSTLWSDPSKDIDGYRQNMRGSGYFFGTAAINDFLNSQNLKLLVRAHQCIAEGYEYSLGHKVATIFSASNYCGSVNNRSAVLKICNDGSYEAITSPPLEYVTRDKIQFNNIFANEIQKNKARFNIVNEIERLPRLDSNALKYTNSTGKISLQQESRALTRRSALGKSIPLVSKPMYTTRVVQKRITKKY